MIIIQEESIDTTVEIEAVMDELIVPNEERAEWLSIIDNSDPGYHEYTDEELVMHVTGINEDEEEEDDVMCPTMSHAQACKALEMVITYLGQQSDTPMSTTVLINSLLSQTARKCYRLLSRLRLGIILLSCT